eukprot:4266202-Prymnesium_polylepis.1
MQIDRRRVRLYHFRCTETPAAPCTLGGKRAFTEEVNRGGQPSTVTLSASVLSARPGARTSFV